MSADKTDEKAQRLDVALMSETSSESKREKVVATEHKSSKSEPQVPLSSVSTTTDQSRGQSQSSASSVSFKSSGILKRKILDQLGIKDVGEIDREDNESLSYFLQIRLEQERKDVEKLRDSNLDKLNFIIDKCNSSKTLTSQSINAIFELFSVRPPGAEKLDYDVNMYHSERKRKKVESSLMSPGSRQQPASDFVRDSQSQYIPQEQQHNRARSHSQSQFQLQQPVMFPYPVQYQGGQGPTPWVSQQLGPQGQIPAGLGSQNRSPRSGSDTATAETISGSTPSGTSHGAPSSMQQTSSQSSAYPSASQVYSVPAPYFLQPGAGRRPPAMMIQQQLNQEGPQQGTQNYYQSLQHIQPPFRVRGDINSVKRQQTHRRSHSSVTTSSNYNSLRSPIKELQATPQKPVNFLIHTPKYPPPT